MKGITDLGILIVNGRILVPQPPTKINAFIKVRVYNYSNRFIFIVKLIIQTPVKQIKMNDLLQSKIRDSKSWIIALQHFTSYNQLGYTTSVGASAEKIAEQVQYVIASTFDKWLSIKMINVNKIYWEKICEMKMQMVVVNSFIEFNNLFQPQGLVLAYMDGSIQYSPWDKIKKNYRHQIQSGKNGDLKKTFNQIIQNSKRSVYLNTILNDCDNEAMAFVLQTVCFLHKKGCYIYAINFKGDIKVFLVAQKQSQMHLIQKIQLKCKIITAKCLVGSMTQNEDGINVTICFENIFVPLVVEISPIISAEKMQKNIDIICHKQEINFQKNLNRQKKLITYDPANQRIITCSQSNEITIYSFKKEEYQKQRFIYIVNPQRVFSLQEFEKKTIINDLDVKENQLVIVCQQSFFTYDVKQEFVIQGGEKLKEVIDIGRIVEVGSESRKILLMVKKKFDYHKPNQRKSTTIHLFFGK